MKAVRIYVFGNEVMVFADNLYVCALKSDGNFAIATKNGKCRIKRKCFIEVISKHL